MIAVTKSDIAGNGASHAFMEFDDAEVTYGFKHFSGGIHAAKFEDADATKLQGCISNFDCLGSGVCPRSEEKC